MVRHIRFVTTENTYTERGRQRIVGDADWRTRPHREMSSLCNTVACAALGPLREVLTVSW